MELNNKSHLIPGKIFCCILRLMLRNYFENVIYYDKDVN